MEQGLKLGTVNATQRLVEVDAALVDEVTAMRKAAAGLRLPTRTWSTHRRPSSTVNSMSHMSRKRVLQRFRMVQRLVVCVRQERL